MKYVFQHFKNQVEFNINTIHTRTNKITFLEYTFICECHQIKITQFLYNFTNKYHNYIVYLRTLNNYDTYESFKVCSLEFCNSKDGSSN